MNLKTFQRKWRINPASLRNYLRRAWKEICTGGVPPPRFLKNVVRTTRPQKNDRALSWLAGESPAPQADLRMAIDGTVPAEVSVVLLNDQQMRCYNREYRQKDYPTDVLSFPVNEIQEELSKGSRRHTFYLGDILISMERTAIQAHEKGHTIQKELKILLLHGVLHLLGYDHEVDDGQMERVERKLRKATL